ncbi:MAG: hypothetical protein ABIF71_03390 [Planctomycetota bacterium]
MRCTAILALICGFAVMNLAGQEPPKTVINPFNAPEDLARIDAGDSGQVEFTIEPRMVTELNPMLKMIVKGGSYPGFAVTVPNMPADWSSYEVLSFVVWTASPVGMGLRVDDKSSTNYATRYNKDGLKIEPGRNLVQIQVSEIGRKLNIKEVRTLIIFFFDLPAGTTFYFDDLQLGPAQGDEIPFIPYAERKDLQPRMDIVTPHFPLARPLAGGPLKAFMLTGVEAGRETVELMQRMDYQPSVMHWDRSWDVNTWGMGDFYDSRGHKHDWNLMSRYLASSMQGPENFETMLMFTPLGWKAFGKGA